jgi:hypothetical protein
MTTLSASNTTRSKDVTLKNSMFRMLLATQKETPDTKCASAGKKNSLFRLGYKNLLWYKKEPWHKAGVKGKEAVECGSLGDENLKRSGRPG